jgi:hypothetical protein
VTTNASTVYWEIECAIVWALWVASFTDIALIDSTADWQINPATASFSEAT